MHGIRGSETGRGSGGTHSSYPCKRGQGEGNNGLFTSNYREDIFVAAASKEFEYILT